MNELQQLQRRMLLRTSLLVVNGDDLGRIFYPGALFSQAGSGHDRPLPGWKREERPEGYRGGMKLRCLVACSFSTSGKARDGWADHSRFVGK